MPIPFLLAGIAIAGAIGAGGHLSAKETNERAQRVSEDAQDLYNDAKASLELSQNKTESALLNLGYAKRSALESSVKQFLQAYDRIKNIKLSESVGLNEIANFAIDQEEAIQLREMSNIYQSTFSSGAKGATAGAVIALAASGSLPVVTGVLSTAGTALLAGEVGVAAGLAGSALSFGAAMTPLAAIAAPVLLFTGISSSIKADENLEKAETMYAEAEAAAEKMRISETLCDAIADRADMFNNLLVELNGMFSECAALLDAVTRKKIGGFKGKTINANNLTEEELKLVAITRSLAGAVKAVIDTPILNKNGSLAKEAKQIYNNTANKLPVFIEAVKEVEAHDYNVKVRLEKPSKNRSVERTWISIIFDAVRNIFALVVAGFFAIIASAMISDIFKVGPLVFIAGSLVFTLVTLLVMNTGTNSKFFRLVKNVFCFSLAVEFVVLSYYYCEILVNMKHFLVFDILLGIVSLFLLGLSGVGGDQPIGNFKRFLQRIFACLLFFAIALLVFAILSRWIGFSFKVSIIITEVLFVPFSLVGAYICDFSNDK